MFALWRPLSFLFGDRLLDEKPRLATAIEVLERGSDLEERAGQFRRAPSLVNEMGNRFAGQDRSQHSAVLFIFENERGLPQRLSKFCLGFGKDALFKSALSD
ncbi:MAG: hypothetical protein WBD95_17600, partial [Xanthobacteraceae bacterium]